MNKNKLLNLMKNLISLYLKKELTIEEYTKLIDNESSKTRSSLKETDFIKYLFESIPYYKIIYVYENVLSEIKDYQVNSSNINFTLIEGCYNNLYTTLKNKIEEETNYHIFELLHIFYEHHNLDFQTSINLLLKNSSHSKIIKEFTKDDNYKQLSLEENIELDSDSKNSKSSKKDTIETFINKLLTKYYTSNTLSTFEEQLYSIIDSYIEKSPIDGCLLKDQIKLNMTTIKNNYTLSKTSIKKKDDTNQLSLFPNL